ncbi:hypothetical protein M758_1G074100 [Ceratodon purpureus]|uniref:EF-hand domain-containing protein n=1 Tax=Ceratodon purpureus TaxID=3225 RepID=A0A8T0J4S8_CERPU|nr:hypothetical protein KC19_1G076000 [Ceratodon purpureus]KAG0629064.1 hypothetical protein M758_1G074100 [Ceratodon purpureus]
MKLSLRKLGSRSSSRRMEAVEVEPIAPLVKELTATFHVFDKDGDGRISKSELGVVLRSLGDDMSDDELDEVLVKVDGDGDGFIDLQEFISFHTGRASTAASSDDSVSRTWSESGDGVSSEEKYALKAAFEVFDVDRNGFISAEELQRVMRSLGEKTSLAECRHMINCVDQDGDNMVDFNEFQCLMSGTFVC